MSKRTRAPEAPQTSLLAAPRNIHQLIADVRRATRPHSGTEHPAAIRIEVQPTGRVFAATSLDGDPIYVTADALDSALAQLLAKLHPATDAAPWSGDEGAR